MAIKTIEDGWDCVPALKEVISEIVNAQVEVCNKIGDMLEEILQMDEKQLQDNLEEQ